MSYLSLRIKMDQWKKAMMWSVLSSLVVLITYVVKPNDIHSAGSVFSYNLTFFFPMLGLSIIFGIIAVVALSRFRKDLTTYEINFKSVRILAVVLLLLPMLLHLIQLLLVILTLILGL